MPFYSDILNFVMLRIIMLGVIMLSDIMLSVIMLSVIMLSVIMLSVVVPFHELDKSLSKKFLKIMDHCNKSTRDSVFVLAKSLGNCVFVLAKSLVQTPFKNLLSRSVWSKNLAKQTVMLGYFMLSSLPCSQRYKTVFSS
jgi:hypothetical protein